MEKTIVPKLIVGITALFVFIMILSLVYTKSNTDAYTVYGGNAREIVIDAKRFEFIPNVIKVKEGEKIKLKINNIDAEHGISIPELGFEVHAESEEEFVFDKKGTFDFYCHHYCGSGHSAMTGVIIVE